MFGRTVRADRATMSATMRAAKAANAARTMTGRRRPPLPAFPASPALPALLRGRPAPDLGDDIRQIRALQHVVERREIPAQDIAHLALRRLQPVREVLVHRQL